MLYLKKNINYDMDVKKITTKEFKHFFPFKKIRNNQKKAIKFILRQFLNHNKKYVILEAGTGIGKSAIAVTVSKYLQQHNKNKNNENYKNSSYFLTTQKILQKQYINDFDNNNYISDIEDIVPYQLKTISSSKNYQCNFYPSICCSEGRKALKYVSKKSDFFKNCSKNCIYKLKKKEFINEKNDGITNFSYFLAETSNIQEIKPKELLVLDECHNLYKELSNFIEITINEQFLKNIGLEFPESFYELNLEEQQDNKHVFKWIKQILLPYLQQLQEKTNYVLKTECQKEIETNELDNEDTQVKIMLDNKQKYSDSSILKKKLMLNNQLEQLIKQIKQFLLFYDVENWIINFNYEMQIVKKKIKIPKKKMKTIDQYFQTSTKNTKKIHQYKNIEREVLTSIELRPIDISKYSKELLFRFGNYTLLMSATILNKQKYCELIGLHPNEVAFLSIPSPFLPENKPIMYCPVGGMGLHTIEITLPKLTKTIKKILKKHKHEKGIIHCHSYKIMNHLSETISSNRLLVHDTKNREEILDYHLTNKLPTVLLSPSMEEGVDLKDNFSRFQIICKIPYPYLGDELVKQRMNKWNWWYSYETVKTIVQAIGRSVRNKKDHAKTYILDQCWKNFYINNKHTFPKNFEKLFI